MSALTDVLDNADREIDLAEAALAEAKWLMIWFERADRREQAGVQAAPSGRTGLGREGSDGGEEARRVTAPGKGLPGRGEGIPRIDTLVKLAGAVGAPVGGLLTGFAGETPKAFRLASPGYGPFDGVR